MARTRREWVTLDLYEGPLRQPSWLANPLLWISLAVIVAIGIVIALSARRSPVPEPVGMAPTVPAAPQAPTPTADAKGGQAARAIIAQHRRQGREDDLSSVYAKAGEFQKNGKLADAYLLYLYAAREGHGPSASRLGEMSDPNHFSLAPGLIDKPDPGQALKWYRVANKNGDPTAQSRLLELQRWVEGRARAGDTYAQQLMLSWR